MVETTGNAPACPVDGAEMAPMGRRAGAWRCPSCNAVFIDVATMRAGRRGAPPAVMLVLVSIVLSVAATLVARRLRPPATT